MGTGKYYISKYHVKNIPSCACNKNIFGESSKTTDEQVNKTT